MKRILSILIAFAVLAGGSAFAKKITFSELPEAVQKTIANQKLGDEKRMTIREETEQGKIIYKVTMKREGQDVKFHVASDGGIIKDTRSDVGRRSERSEVSYPDGALNAPLGKSERLRLGDAPLAVQNAVKAEVSGAENATLEKDMKGGRTVYHVDIETTGKNVKLSLAEDGTILKDNRKEGLTAKLGLRKLTLSEVPPAVQSAIRTQAAATEISDIRTEKQGGRTVYKVELKQKGKNTHFWVAEDGSIVKDERQAEGAAVEEKAGAENPAPIPSIGLGPKSERNLALSDVPKAVQEAIAQQQGTATVEGTKINQLTRDGKIYYEVKFQKEGEDVELHIGEDGVILPKKN